MALSKQDGIDNILSFGYEELARWIKSRLQGFDGYFPIYEGHEPNLNEFLSESFHHIKNETFRENFLEILDDLVTELWAFTRNKKKIEKNKEYIYELLSLCGGIKKFENKSTLYRVARKGRLKGFKAYDVELHQLLLTTLASYHVGGDYNFWIEQMQDDSNKYYANAAFYALLNRGFRLDILFNHIGIFIDRFMGEIDLVLGIKALVNDYGEKEISGKFKGIEEKLSRQQKEAVNQAFTKAGYNAVYSLDILQQKKLQYKPSAPSFQYISEPTPQYGTTATLQDRVGEIFKLMGFDVETNREIADYTIDLFIKKKKTIGDIYECWICFFDTGTRKVRKDIVDVFYPIREAVREELERLPGVCDDCQAVIISEKGFTKEAVKAVKVYGIQLKTYEELLADLSSFYSHHKKLIRNLEINVDKRDE